MPLTSAKHESVSVPEELSVLVTSVRNVVNGRRSRGKLPLGGVLYTRYKLSGDLDFRDDGVEVHSLSAERFIKQDWTLAASQIVRAVHDTPEFAAAANALAGIAPNEPAIDTHLSNFVMRVAARLAGSELGEDESSAESKRLVQLILFGPKARAAKVELVGLVLDTPRIALPNVVIRRPTRQDFEREVMDLSYRGEQVKLPLPSAIAELDLIGSTQKASNVTVLKLVTMLRLFVVAGVRFRGCTTDYGPSIAGNAGTWLPGDGDHEHGDYLVRHARIRLEDEDRLRRFWLEVYPILPAELQSPSPRVFNHISVAYDRYLSALLRNDILEERVANAVMGLEALFLREKQELEYRCRLRVAKVMSHLGENPKIVFDLLKDAYKARNCFAHGDRLSVESLDRIHRKYAGAEKIFFSAMQYLRKGLVSMIVGQLTKDALIEQVDSSLIDPSYDAMLSTHFLKSSLLV